MKTSTKSNDFLPARHSPNNSHIIITSAPANTLLTHVASGSQTTETSHALLLTPRLCETSRKREEALPEAKLRTRAPPRPRSPQPQTSGTSA
jgi:hypothetical protein